MRVSEFYNLERGQASLEFVDVDISNDVPMFIDPGAIRMLQVPLARECTSSIQSFFTKVLELTKSGRNEDARHLLASLGEPNETRLGLSSGKASGHGMSDGLAHKLWESLSKSRAVASGVLSDLEETALFVEGVDRDIISDIVTNIIRGSLSVFTRSMALKYRIPTTEVLVAVWDRFAADWRQALVALPTAADEPLLLVPRVFVRRGQGVYNADRYYRHFVIPYLQDQHFNANTELVRLLSDGTRRPPFKKTLMEEHPNVKEVNVEMTEEELRLLSDYKADASKKFEVVSHEDLARGVGVKPPNFDALLADVLQVEPGDAGATAYHRAVERLLTALFYPALDFPVIEQKLDEGRKRVDIDYTNLARHGFFHWMHSVHGVGCSFIPVECKNYSRKLKNPEYDQLTGRFSTQRGAVGILCYRGFTDKQAVVQHCRDAALAGRGYVIALDDEDLGALVTERQEIESGEDFSTLWNIFKLLL